MSGNAGNRKSCRALVITCPDYRIQTAERELLLSLGLLDDYDIIARPGSIRSLVAPRSPAYETTLREEIQLLWGLHHFTQIVAVNHLTCGAYADIATSANERELQVEHLRRARRMLQGFLTDVSVATYLAEPGGGSFVITPIE